MYNDGEMTAMVRGAMVKWQPKVAVAAKLRAALEQIGLGDYAPNPETPEAALQHAMRDWGAQLKKVRVATDDAKHQFTVMPRRDKRDDGFELVDVARKQGPNGYQCECACKIEKTSDGKEKVKLVQGYMNLIKAQEAYDIYRSQASGTQVGRSLRALVHHLHGTCTCVDEGGIYYLPDDVVPLWDDVRAAFESTGMTRVHRWRIVLDDDAKRDIYEGIEQELTKAAAAILDELAKGTLREDTVERRKQECLELRAKAYEYDGILNKTLTRVHIVLDSVEQAAAAYVAVQEDTTVFDNVLS